MDRCIFVLLCNLTFVLLFLPSSWSLFEDQIGKFDWRKRLIGKVKYSDFYPDDRRAIFVGTEDNVVAALSFETGDIIWRHVLEKGGRGDIKLLTCISGGVLSVSGNDVAIVRLWDKTNGAILVEYKIPYPNVKYDKSQSSLWFINNKLLHRILIYGDSNIAITKYDVSAEQLKGDEVKIILSISEDSSCAYSKGWIGCCNKLGLLTAFNVEDSTILKSQVINDEHLKQLQSVIVTPVPDDENAAFLVRFSNINKLIFVTNDGIRIAIDVGSSDVYLFPATIGTIVLTIESLHPTRIQVSAIEMEKHVSIPHLSAKYDYPGYIGPIKIQNAYCSINDVGETACEILISSEDAVLTLITIPGKVKWTREEALTSIVTVEMIELPMSQTEAFIQNEFDCKDSTALSMLFRRITSQLLQMQKAFILEEVEDSKNISKLVRDRFNLHKIILVVTKYGKIIAMDNVSKSILWSYLIPNVEPFISNGGDPQILLFLQRTSRHYPHFPQCTVLLQDKNTKKGVLHTFNPITGAPLIETIRLNYKVKQAILLPEQNDEYVYGIAILDDNYKIHVYPESELDLVKNRRDTLFSFVAYRDTGRIIGLGFNLRDKNDMTMIPLWNVTCNGKLLKIASKNPLEKVHSLGHVQLDRTVLYKYINPNLIAVLSEKIDPKDGKMMLNLFLMDSITGLIVYAANHARATGPVHLIHSENWIVLFYVNDKSKRTEVASYELFEGMSQQNPTVFSSINSDAFLPLVDSRSYVLPVSYIEAARETITEKGIANRQILVALGTGHILEIPWMFLDPKRPNEVTPEMREEFIIPYVPELPVSFGSFINYNQTLSRISGIYTVPSSLESTCLVFVYGLDLYYTRVAPSKTFDLLKDDFDYILIMIVLAALVAITFITRHFAYKKALAQAWK